MGVFPPHRTRVRNKRGDVATCLSKVRVQITVIIMDSLIFP